MIDGVTLLKVATDPDKLRSCPLLVNLFDKEYARLKGLRFEIKNLLDKDTGEIRKVIQLNGSVHKYRNEGVHNSDDFNANDAISTIEKICNNFEIDPQRTGINGVEFGVNVVLPFPVKLLLDNLICYDGKPFKSEIKEGMRFYKCEKTQFSIKAYDKGLQNKLPINLLRFEVSADKKQIYHVLICLNGCK